MGLVNEKGLAGEVGRHLFRRQLVEGGVCARERIVGRPRLTQVGGDLPDGTETAGPRSADQPFGSRQRGLSHARTVGKGDELVIALDEPLLDLLLRRRDHRVSKAPAQMHGHQRDDLHRLARPGRLFDQHVLGCPADVGHQAHLVRTEFLCGGLHGW